MKIGVLDTLGISVLGLAVVFLMLVILMVMIYILTAIIRKFSKPAAEAPAPAAEPAPAKLAPGSCGEVQVFDVPDATAAMIMAIVADKMGTPLNELRFISIKEAEDEKK